MCTSHNTLISHVTCTNPMTHMYILIAERYIGASIVKYTEIIK
jgi:hypothetical protein